MPLKQALGADQRLGDLSLVEILKARLHALDHAPGGDVSSHGAGADDVHLERLEAVLPRLALGRLVLEHLRQLEHAAEIARGLARHQRDEHLGLGDLHAHRVVAIALEEIDEPERGRIMLLAHLLRGLGAHLLGEHGAHRLLEHQPLPPRRALGVALLQHGLARGPAEIVAGRHQLIDEADRLGRRGTQHAAGQHGGHGVHGAGGLDRAHRAV
jgi:hypothetical protein